MKLPELRVGFEGQMESKRITAPGYAQRPKNLKPPAISRVYRY